MSGGSIDITKMVDVMRSFSLAIQNQGYFGPINLDIFVKQNHSLDILVHDFNQRDGGSSASGSFTFLIGGERPTIDRDMVLVRNTPLTLEEGNEMIRTIFDKTGILPYSSTFLRYPQILENGQYQYVIKVIAPTNGPIISDLVAEQKVTELNETLSRLGYGIFH